ncbi:kinetochore-associated protein 1-like [Saccoglossus kowalevskii]
MGSYSETYSHSQLLSQAENGHLENGFDHNISTFNNIILQQQNNNGSYNLTISATNDSCYLFSNILLKELCQALQNRDIAAAKKVKESIQMECINTSEVHTESNNNAVICDNTLDMNLVTIGKGDSCVTVWQEENNTMQPYMLSAHMMPDQGYLKCKISHDNKFIFLLDNQNNLSMLDFKSLVTCAYWSTIKVQDFILMTVGSVQTMDKDGDLGYGFRVIVLTVPNPECYLQVYSLPGMKLTYSLEVGCHSALVDAPLSQEKLYLTSVKLNGLIGCTKEVNPSFSVTVTTTRIIFNFEAIDFAILYHVVA